MEEYAGIEGIEGQVLVLYERSPLYEDGGGGFRLKAWKDFEVSDGVEHNIRLDEVTGKFLTAGNQVYVPVPQGKENKHGKFAALSASINRYTRVTINQEVVLLPDHALERKQNGESLKTTGILIKLRLGEDDYERFDMTSLKSLPSEKLILN